MNHADKFSATNGPQLMTFFWEKFQTNASCPQINSWTVSFMRIKLWELKLVSSGRKKVGETDEQKEVFKLKIYGRKGTI